MPDPRCAECRRPYVYREGMTERLCTCTFGPAPAGDFGRARPVFAGPRGATRDRMVAVRAELSTDPDAAATAEELSAVLGLTVCQVKTVLTHLEATGQAARRNRLRAIGELGRPPVGWWAT